MSILSSSCPLIDTKRVFDELNNRLDLSSKKLTWVLFVRNKLNHSEKGKHQEEEVNGKKFSDACM